MIGVVFDTAALLHLGSNKRVSAFIAAAARGELHVCVPALTLVRLASDNPTADIAVHALRLCMEVPDQRMYVAPVAENALSIGESMKQQDMTADLVLGQTTFEARELRWPVITTADRLDTFTVAKVEAIAIDR